MRSGASSSSGTRRAIRRQQRSSQQMMICRCSYSASSATTPPDGLNGRKQPAGLREWLSDRMLAASLAIYRSSGLGLDQVRRRLIPPAA